MPRSYLVFVVALAACGEVKQEQVEVAAVETETGPLKGYVTVDRLPMPVEAKLLEGRTVWEGTCQACHGLGVADSPKITDKDAWAPRIAQGKDTLYQHAIGGYIGPSGTMMPERGGNAELSDEQIKAAVDYMVEHSS